MNTDFDKQNIAHLFNHIAPHYDFLNHFLSFGIDKCWRKKAIRSIPHLETCALLDVATGTGDFAIAAVKQGAKRVVGIDISEEMLKKAVKKSLHKKVSEKIHFQLGNSNEIPSPNQSFDAVTVAFGVRNFAQPEKGLQEIHRVLKPSGTVVILEFAMPQNKVVSWLYNIYFFHLLPFIGGLISGDKKAYRYLPHSVIAFPQGDDFLEILKNCGFSNTQKTKLSFGIAYIYVANK